MTHSALLQELNAQQRAVVQHEAGPALVIAGAGSGKTRVITHRVAHLIQTGVPPERILMVTFTNKAAEEMRTRVQVLLEREGLGERVVSRLLCGTFHALGNRFLRRYAKLTDLAPNYSILDEVDAKELLKASVAEKVERTHGPNGQRFPKPGELRSLLSLAFNRQISLGELVETEQHWLSDFLPELEAVRQDYQQRKQANNGVDFDDLLGLWAALLAQFGPRLESTQRLRYVLVDEYQDTNAIQSRILDLLIHGHRNLMVVGDDAQSIYGWRGANYQNILSFPERFGGQVYRLEQNYRSTPNILNLANHSIAQNQLGFPKTLQTVRAAGARPRCTHLLDVHEEARYLVARTLYYHKELGIPLSEIGMLYRGHAQSVALQVHLSEAGLPFAVRSGIRFFEQAHVKDVLSFLKVIFNPLDELAWRRILRMLPGVGTARAGRIHQVFVTQQAVRLVPENEALQRAVPAKAREAWKMLLRTFLALQEPKLTPTQMIHQVRQGFYAQVLQDTYENAAERESDLISLAEFAARYGTLEGLLSQLALVEDSASVRSSHGTGTSPECITLSTVHQAKGLEWRVIFILGLIEGRFPHARCLEPLEQLEEERRLFYVAVTRCKEHLEITAPRMSYLGGTAELCRPSRFVEQIPEELLSVERMGLHTLRGLSSRSSEISVEL